MPRAAPGATGEGSTRPMSTDATDARSSASEGRRTFGSVAAGFIVALVLAVPLLFLLSGGWGGGLGTIAGIEGSGGQETFAGRSAGESFGTLIRSGFGTVAKAQAEAEDGVEVSGTDEGGSEAFVIIRDSTFRPGVIRVPVGTTVVWQFEGRLGHTVTADDGSFDSGI